MERLWSPWRMTYIGGAKQPGCVFCNALAAADDRKSLIIHRGENAFMILNLYPYNSGHSMVVPNEHISEFENLPAATRAELFELAAVATEASRRALGCDGFNIGMNLGAVAGAGIADHLHAHVVPRWNGDANFMPIIGDTKVMPELLPSTYARIRAEVEIIIGARKSTSITHLGAIVVVPGSGIVVTSASDAPALPRAPIVPTESATATALRAVRDALDIDAAVVGWGGIAESGNERTLYFLAAASSHAESAASLDELTSSLPTEAERRLLTDNAAVIRTLIAQ